MLEHAIFQLIKGLAWLGENFPDNPRLGRRLLLFGVLFTSVFFLPYSSADSDDPVFGLMILSLVIGIVLLVLGAFIFFRRWVWKRQDKRAPVVTTLLPK